MWCHLGDVDILYISLIAAGHFGDVLTADSLETAYNHTMINHGKKQHDRMAD